MLGIGVATIRARRPEWSAACFHFAINRDVDDVSEDRDYRLIAGNLSSTGMLPRRRLTAVAGEGVPRQVESVAAAGAGVQTGSWAASQRGQCAMSMTTCR